jgi:hypothetical protein
MEIKEYYRESNGFWRGGKYTLFEMYELYRDDKDFQNFIKNRKNGNTEEKKRCKSGILSFNDEKT